MKDIELAPRLRRRDFLQSLGWFGLALSMGAPRLASATPGTPAVRLGIDMLEAGGFAYLRGKRVGLLTHPAGVNRLGVSTIEVLRRSPQVNLVALFGPEHGIYGDEKANVPIEDKTDPHTGLPVYSLYGRFRRPTAHMLAQLDVMVIDLQDIGSRSYTYVSCMRYVIEEIFKANKEVIVLDRPNPLGGLKVDGPPLERSLRSYVGAFQVPYVHGLTIGELANLAHQRAGVLEVDEAVRKRGRLRIIPMSGWRRDMMWPDTGLRWIPTSPAIPDLSAVLGYTLTGLGCQIGGFSHGYGTHLPFRLLQFSGKSPETIADTLTARRIVGLDFPVVPFTRNQQSHRATYVRVTNWQAVRPTELSLHLMAIAVDWSPGNPFAAASPAAQDLFNKHIGDPRVLQALIQHGANIPIAAFVDDWQRYGEQFKREMAAYRLY